VELQTLKAQFAAEFIDLREAAQVEEAAWESFQFAFLNNATRFGIDAKSRQVGWSFTSALDAFCDSRIEPGNPYIFVSINQDEAKEKIRYLRAIFQATDAPLRPKRLVTDSQTEIELDDGTRFISHPCRPVRGKPKARIYLDEMAHYPQGMDRQIYTAALPATTKGGYIRIGSSTMGAKGLFWEIMTESLRPWSGFARRYIPWWDVTALCKNRQAAKSAAEMPSRTRVERFGTPALLDIFENMFLEDFQQEYECDWVDESSAWITWDVITRNQRADLKYWHAHSVGEALSMAMELQAAIPVGEVEQAFSGGIDVGRTHDLTEFVVTGKSTSGQMPVRMMVSLDRVEFAQQKACFAEIIKRLPFTQVLVDRNGIGMQLAEDLERETGKAQGVDFTNTTKEVWAVEARIQAERSNTPLPPDRDLAYQIHSIKKKVTEAKNNVFDTERNEKHHADKFWAWALALYAGHTESAGGFAGSYRTGINTKRR
jgi:phage FluMu gp28-like protein